MSRWSVSTLCTVPLLAFAAACSLLDLGDVEVPPCKSHADCDAAIREAGDDPERCRSYLCNLASGFCEPASAEHCDTWDNDCDGLVDEGIEGEPHAFTAPAPASDESFAYASRSNGPTYVTAGNPANGWVISPDDGSMQMHPLRFEFDAADGLETGCPGSAGAVLKCKFAQLAFAALGDGLIMAGINTAGCGTGQVRFGVSSGAEPFDVFLGSLESGNPLLLGVPSIDDCSPGRSSSFPALAVAEASDGVHALAIWLEAELNSQSAVVRGLGLVVPSTPRTLLEVESDGEPDALGESTCRSAPAVLGDDGPLGQPPFVVAFPGEQEGTPGIVLRTAGSGPSTHAQLDAFSKHIPDPEPGPVALAPGPPDAAESPSVALAWRAGCGTASALSFTRVSFPAGAEPTHVPPLRIATGPIVRGPELFYAPTGFATANPQGGWFVLWEESTADTRRLQVARIAARELEHLETRTVALGVPETWFPRPSAGGLAYGALEDEKGGPEPVVVSSVSCVESD